MQKIMVTLMTIEEAIEELELLKWQKGITNFIITETFNQTKEFQVRNLSIETEDDIVFCSDDCGIIEKIGSVLFGFLKQSLLYIKKVYDTIGNFYYGLFEFKDGSVIIKVV